jgi:phosphoribosylamine--glycine ligase/phosphoribosylformylglycinamidine cyclo-ligase
MLTNSGPKVLEYNVRFGDPETEALMLLLSEDTDLAAVILVRTNFLLTRAMTLRLSSCVGLR